MAERTEGVSIDVLELAYAEHEVRKTKDEASAANEARRTAEEEARAASSRASVAREALADVRNKIEAREVAKHRESIIELLGLNGLEVPRGERVVIAVTDEVAEAYRQLLIAEETRKRETGIYEPSHGEEQYSSFHLSLEGMLLDNKAELTPGTPFVQSSMEKFPEAKDDVMIVAPEVEGRPPVSVIFEVRKSDRNDELSWSLGLRINIEGQDEPYEHFHSAPLGLDIDHHIQGLINGYKKIMDQPVHDTHPLDPIALANKLEKFKKTKLVRDLRRRAGESLVSVISGASYTTFPNQHTEAPQYSEERYVELLTELEKLGADKLEAAIDARAERAVHFLRWQNDDVNPRPAGNYLSISQDTYVFVSGELMFRRAQDETPEPITTDDFVDAMGDFYKRGYRLKATKKAAEKAGAK